MTRVAAQIEYQIPADEKWAHLASLTWQNPEATTGRERVRYFDEVDESGSPVGRWRILLEEGAVVVTVKRAGSNGKEPEYEERARLAKGETFEVDFRGSRHPEKVRRLRVRCLG